MIRLLFISLLLISLQLVSCQGNTGQTDSYEVQVKSIQPDSVLIGIQSKIYNAFVQGMMSQKNDELINLNNELEQLYIEKNQKLILYWNSYLKFYSSIYYLKTGD
ncbi:MAG: hypothetical protein KAG95_07120, partial [Bacteroidales bacterium]|nr:hypothetical protein [Bacteroidales bacterium]